MCTNKLNLDSMLTLPIYICNCVVLGKCSTGRQKGKLQSRNGPCISVLLPIAV